MFSALKFRNTLMFNGLLFLLLATGACTPLLPQAEPVRLMTLSALEKDSAQTTNAQALHPVASVRIQASRQYDSNRLLVLSGAHEVLPYQGVRWAIPLPQLLAERWAQSLERAGVAGLAYTEASKFSVLPAATLHLRAFHVRVDDALAEAPQFSCELDATLEWVFSDGSASAQRRVLPLQLSEPLVSDNIEATLVACDRMHQKALIQALEWLQQ